jgi:signal peptidase II
MLYMFLALVVAAVDQLTKAITVHYLRFNDTVDIIPGVLSFTRVKNTGIAFSMLSNSGWLMMAIIIILILVVGFVMLRAKLTGFERFCLALVLGGALGNLLDRIFYGYVLDMIEIKFVKFAVFNFADCCITVGCIMFAIAYLVFHDRAMKKKANLAKIERIRKKREEQQ